MSGILNGRIAIITGASAGIGRATALKLSKEGAAVVIQARRAPRLHELVAEIQRGGGRALAVAGDAAKEADIDTLVTRTQEFSNTLGFAGRIDIVVVNAGRGLAGGLISSDDQKWREMFELNVLGAARLMRRTGKLMVEAGQGDILALGSVSGHNISPFSGFYGSSKFAVASMAEAFRREVCSRGVRVTVIKPGIVKSEFQAVAGYTLDNFYKGVEYVGKLLEPEDIAATIAFVVAQPRHVHLTEIVIRPTGQDYP